MSEWKMLKPTQHAEKVKRLGELRASISGYAIGLRQDLRGERSTQVQALTIHQARMAEALTYLIDESLTRARKETP